MKLKNILCAAVLSAAVAIVFCGCGKEAEKSQETGIEIKKISEEEVYELYAQVKQKREKIEGARLSMDQGFQEKWDLLKRKMDSADLALGKNNFDTASKFLQEAESAADWIMNRGPLRAEADEKYSELESRKRNSNSSAINAPKYASTIYAEAEKYEQQGREAYEKIEFEKATRLYVLAANEYKKATSTASAFHAAVYEMNASKEKADKESAPYRYVPALCQEALSYSQQAAKANAQGKYDEALQLLDAAEGTFEKAEKEAAKNVLPYLIKSFVKIEEKNYYIGKYEVTQAQWKAVMGNNPAPFKGADRPVQNVNWHDAMEFCKKLNDMGLAPAGYQFSLPTEAQWEYAARGGNLSKGYEYSGSNDINEVAWYGNNSGDKPHDVGTKKPNELGLYDMSGNVWEWCLDATGSKRFMRGGGWCWHDRAHYCQVAHRSFSDPDYRYKSHGFRLALVPVQ